jgi:hypothetical protein
MTNAFPTPTFTLPADMILDAEVNHLLPKAKRSHDAKDADAVPPSLEIMMELKGLLTKLHPDYPHPKFRWIHVLIIIHFETAGHPEGFALADKWSRRGAAYKGTTGVRKYWDKIKPCPKNPLTIRTLHWMVDQKSQGL